MSDFVVVYPNANKSNWEIMKAQAFYLLPKKKQKKLRDTPEQPKIN